MFVQVSSKGFLILQVITGILLPQAGAEHASFLSPASQLETTLLVEDTSALVGRWEWQLKLGASSGKAILEVSEDKGLVKAVLIAPDGRKIHVKDFKFHENQVSFNVERTKGFLKVRISHQGVLKQDAIRGEYTATAGQIKKQGKWHATRVKHQQSEE